MQALKILLGRSSEETKRLNLALQGGGAHGAFTWGVLDRLLEEDVTELDGVSGTSAGALNAIGLAAGLMQDGPAGARDLLARLWQAVSEKGRYLRPATARPGALHVMTQVFSPYDLNPLDFNPLREVLEEHIDFKRLRRRAPVSLHLAATDVATGRSRIFKNSEMSVEVVLASTCLPQLHRAVKIGQRHYWDGGYSANPALLPLILDTASADTLIVQIDPARESQVPKRAREISERVNRITFNGPLQREIEWVAYCQQLANEGVAFGGRIRRRFREHRFHRIEAQRYTRPLGQASKLSPDWDMLVYLRDKGRGAAGSWLRKNLADVGRRSTVEFEAGTP